MKDIGSPDPQFPITRPRTAAESDASRASGGFQLSADFSVTVLLSFLMGLSYALPAHLGFAVAPDLSLSALAWPGPALGVALLWRRRPGEWPFHLLLAAAGLALVGASASQPPTAVDAILVALGLLETVLGAWVGRRWVARDGQLDSSARLWLFTLLLPVVVSLLHSLLVSGLLWGSGGAERLGPWQRVYIADAMGMFTLVPGLLAWGSEFANPVVPDRSRWLPAAGVVACLGLAAVPHVHDEVVRLALTLPLGWAAVRSGMVLVAQLNAVAAIGMVALTLAGFGPYVEFGYAMWTLQVDLIGIAALSMLLAVTIDERQRLTARLEQARRFESLGFLAGGVAHDFNNVLGTIRVCAEMASERMAPESPGHTELAQLTRATERGSDMTQQILLAARQGDPARESVDFNALVDEAIGMARMLCPAHIRIAHAGTAPTVLAHRGQLLRAVQNLLRNAIQAARHDVTLTLGTQDAAGVRERSFDVLLGDAHAGGRAHGWVEVVDDGPGIDPRHWPHLFDPFYSTRQSQGGTGLGLAIVAGVASGHGGWVGMATATDRGSRFRLAVPLFESARAGIAGPTTRPSA